tara:strand:+ start:865 stop:1452 length:588 start_codon:yes stop_codon:yes gene_type:complete
MSDSKKAAPKARQTRKRRDLGIYSKNVLSRKVFLPFNVIGSNIIENIHELLKEKYEGKCCKEGYLKTDSIKILNHSSGIIRGNDVLFDVAFESQICRPVEGMKFKVIAKNITKAGIRAETKEEKSPVVVFIARDHHHKNKDFSKIKEGDQINIRVIGIRYELNDEYISIIAELVKSRKSMKPIKIVIKQSEGKNE